MSRRNDSGNTESKDARPLYGRMAEGDYAGARREARRLLADPGASEEARAAARDVLGRTGFDRGALALALVGLAVVAAIAALLLLK